jgi:uracil-DNA glycosylase
MQALLTNALLELDSNYLEFILQDNNYIPNANKIFNAFKTLPKERVKYILFGQDPYPREQSAIGYAFIDGAVKDIFAPTGLSKEVNRATSLRNFIKMALVADGRLQKDKTSQEDIAKLAKDDLISRVQELQKNFEKNGVLLLNTALLFTDKKSSKTHIKAWQPFTEYLLKECEKDTTLILFGNHAKDILKKFNPKQPFIALPHPYNISFISRKDAHQLFAPMNLLKA